MGLILAAVDVYARPTLPADIAPAIGNTRWVTLLCRYADATDVTPQPRSFFEGLMGDAYPGMGDYWRENSYGQLDFTNDVVLGWFDLPLTREEYFIPAFDFYNNHAIVNDCMGTADDQINFPDFYGVAVFLNVPYDIGRPTAVVDNRITEGGFLPFDRDGATKEYGFFMMSPGSSQPLTVADPGILAHETGHAYGLFHTSNGSSSFDTMSGIGCTEHPEFGCVSNHVAAIQKDLLGWIPPERKLTVHSGMYVDVQLSRLALPSEEGVLMVKVPIFGSETEFYTVESRHAIGYDNALIFPHAPQLTAFVVIHRVNINTSAEDWADLRRTGVEYWLPGERFVSTETCVAIIVRKQTELGHKVSVESSEPPCPNIGRREASILPIILPLILEDEE